MMALRLEQPRASDARAIVARLADELTETVMWYDELDPTFKFMLTVPFVVVTAGLSSDWLRQRRSHGNRDAGGR
jgi:hypothetical protein